MSVAMANSTDSQCATNVLATYQYDPFSRRTNLAYGASASMAYGYTNAGDLTGLTLNMTGSGNDNAWTLQYTNAHQLTSEAASIANYKWQQPTTSTGTDNYSAVSTLNQYPTVTPSGSSAQTQTYDRDGNLSGDGTLTYSYDPENRLVSACNTSACSGTMSAAYAYDPLGRRQEKSGTGVTATVFLQDGDDEIAEYDTSGNLQRRFVPGPAIDEPIAMVPASGTTELFYTDHHGSIVATSDASGNLIEGPFTYDPYGNCYSGTSACSTLSGGEPFKFTGQYLDLETGCYYYRARYYCADPLRGGRFLQTDPVGYTSDLNLYTYVANDPTDHTDPTGLCCYESTDPNTDPTSQAGARQMQFAQQHPSAAMAEAVVAGSIMAAPVVVAACAGGGCEAGAGALAVRMATSAGLSASTNAVVTAAKGGSPQQVLTDAGKGVVTGPATTLGGSVAGAPGAALSAYGSTLATGGSSTDASIAAFAAGATELITGSPTTAGAVGNAVGSFSRAVTKKLISTTIKETTKAATQPHCTSGQSGCH